MATHSADPSRRGLFRIDLPGFGPCARTHRAAGDASPFLERETYEALRFAPPFDQLPSREEYRASEAKRPRPARNYERYWLPSPE